MTKIATQAAAATLLVGDAAPAFDMAASDGKRAKLADFAGKNVVLYFYPKDDTPGCTIEAKDFRDLMGDFAKADTVILPFMIGSDEDGSVCDAYGVWVEKSMYGKKYMGIERATFLIDGKGVIKNIWRKVSVDGHAKAVLAAVS